MHRTIGEVDELFGMPNSERRFRTFVPRIG